MTDPNRGTSNGFTVHCDTIQQQGKILMDSDSTTRNAATNDTPASAPTEMPGIDVDSENSANLLAQCQSPDEAGPNAIYARYACRLLAFAQSRLSDQLAARIDPDDVVQSAWRSFFVGAREGNFHWQRSGDLWRLLIQITSHKLLRQVAHHQADKRAITEEQQLDPSLAFISREPSPDAAAAVIDELEWVMGQLTPLGQRALELRLQGERLEKIATLLRCTERTVRRQIDLARKILNSRRRE